LNFSKSIVLLTLHFFPKFLTLLITKHFKEGITRQRINRIIKRYKERGTADYLKIAGRPSKRSVKFVKKLIDKEPGI
jgi:hypothetical protein